MPLQLPPRGLEADSITADSSRELRQTPLLGGAADGAFDGKTADFDPELCRVIDAWPSLPESIRRAILELVAQGQTP
jgi:hypothetical protein